MHYRVIVGMPTWAVGGVESFAVHLVRGLIGQGVPAHVFVTQPGVDHGDAPPLPSDIPMEQSPWSEKMPLRARWRAMIRYLEDLAPCIYLPNHDWKFSCVSSKLSNRVGVIGHIHGDIDMFYEHFAAFGRYWNFTVACSNHVAKKAAALYPSLSQRLVVIPYGVSFPRKTPIKARVANGPLRVVYTGRLKHALKRVLDLPLIVEAVARRQVPVELSITGCGPDESALKARCKPLVDDGLIRFLGVLPEERLPELYAESDAFILTSESEGKPLSLVQAMGHGCVPVVTDLPSGIPDLVHDGKNGYAVPVGACEVFADRLALLFQDPTRRQEMAQNAYATVAEGGYRVEDMTASYLHLFRKVWQEDALGTYRRPRGRIALPPFVNQKTWKDRLPTRLRAMGGRCKRLLRRVF